MDDEQVSGAIEEIERALLVEDPAFVHRVRKVQRSEAANFVTVFVLLGVGAVLLTVGLATALVIPWAIGLVALIAAVLVDGHHHRMSRWR